MQTGEEAVERDERLIGIFRARELVDQHRHQLGEMGARELALERAVFAGEPAPHRLTDLERTAKAHCGELVERLGVVFCGGKCERAAGGFGGGRVLEQPGVMALHLS